MIVTNTVSGASRHLYVRSLGQLNYETISKLYELITQSDTEVELQQLEWRFTIFPNSFRAGGSSDSKPPSWLVKKQPKLKHLSWFSYSDEQGPIACAAVALLLTTDMIGTAKNGGRYHIGGEVGINRLKKRARALQTELGWDQYVSYLQFQDYVKLYPFFRVTVLSNSQINSKPYTFTGEQFLGTIDPTSSVCSNPFAVYVYHDPLTNHYASISKPAAFYSALYGYDQRFCHVCVKVFGTGVAHACDGAVETRKNHRKKEEFVCPKCNEWRGKTHDCTFYDCRNCFTREHKGSPHRCMIMVKDPYKVDKGFQTNPNEFDKDKPALWVYDLESKIEYKEVTFSVLDEFEVDGDMRYKKTEKYKYCKALGYHKADLVTASNVYTGELKTWKGDTCLQEFCSYLLNYNRGNNIVLAHNGSGYDSALVHEAISKAATDYRENLIVNGTRFLQLVIGAGRRNGSNTKFQDSMVHVMGSIRALIQEFAPDMQLRKGHFPHAFNTRENAGKVFNGPPSIKYYDVAFGAKKEKEVKELQKWIDENQNKPWDFDENYLQYNIEDVKCLAHIVKTYNDILYEKFGQCPWKKVTSASYSHLISLIDVTKDMELPDFDDPTRPSVVAEKCKDNWVKLLHQEHAMVKAAFRGGRTEARQLSFELTDEEYVRGDRIRYFDVVSLYPYVQIANDYPVGSPTIYVFDELYSPCRRHKHSISVCTICSPEHRFQYDGEDFGYDIKFEMNDWPVERFLDPTFGGVVYATVTAPNMIHPILPLYVEQEGKENKLVFPCGTFTSAFMAPEFKLALENGYVINKMHCVHQYKLAPTKWDILKKLYIGKMVNSEAAPPREEWQDMIDYYEENFEMGDEVRKSLENNEWGNNPAVKQTYKILLNSMWGKHAENPVKDQMKVYDYKNKNDQEKADELFLNVSQNNYELKTVIPLAEDRFLYRFQVNGQDMKADLSKTYLPAAAYVTCYGRIKLWKMMNLYGKDLLYNDTDSVFVRTRAGEPDKFTACEYWGGWKEEGPSKQGIKKVICFAAKCYGFKLFNGDEKIRAKGLSLKYGVSKLINFDIMEKLMNNTLATGKDSAVHVPQKRFIRRIGDGIHTRNQLKIFNCSLDGFKGPVDETGYVYPPGYTGVDFTALF